MTVLIGYTSYNRLGYSRQTLPALLSWAERTGADVEIVVVDDASTDGSAEYLRELYAEQGDTTTSPWRALLLGTARQGHAVCSNAAWRRSGGDYVKFDNDVLILRDDWLAVLLDYARRIPAAGVIGHNCEIRLHEAYREQVLYNDVRYCQRDTIAGACILIPSETRERCGRWNEREPGQTFSRGLDVVYSAKVKAAGLREIYTTGGKNAYVKCLQGGEEIDYAEERGRLKREVPAWTHPVIRAYQTRQRPLNDVS